MRAEEQKKINPASALRFSGEGEMTLDRPRIMGVLNVTPDSFSDGGRYDEAEAAVVHGLRMAAEGADLIDVGGESSRPGAERIPPAEQIARTAKVIAALRSSLDDAEHNAVAISIDTTSADVAEAALDAGATMLNDISAGREDERILSLTAERGVPICLMHMHGKPKTMQAAPSYDDVVTEIEAFLAERVEAAVAAGVDRSQVLIDPGIGFGKTVEHNLAILRALPRYVATGQPVLLGTSRKSFLAKLQGRADLKVEPDPAGGTAATTALGVAAGVQVFRVHDVALNHQAAIAAASVTSASSGE
ncbi:MAG: dihydropteroate synthase [Planctomycetota bacterium]